MAMSLLFPAREQAAASAESQPFILGTLLGRLMDYAGDHGTNIRQAIIVNHY